MKIQAATTAQQCKIESVVLDAPLLLIVAYPSVKQEQGHFTSCLLYGALKTTKIRTSQNLINSTLKSAAPNFNQTLFEGYETEYQVLI